MQPFVFCSVFIVDMNNRNKSEMKHDPGDQDPAEHILLSFFLSFLKNNPELIVIFKLFFFF